MAEQPRPPSENVPSLRGGCLLAGLLGVLVLVVFLLAGGGRWLLEFSGLVPRPDPIAGYDRFAFTLRGDQVVAFHTFGYYEQEPWPKLPDIYHPRSGAQGPGHLPPAGVARGSSGPGAEGKLPLVTYGGKFWRNRYTLSCQE